MDKPSVLLFTPPLSGDSPAALAARQIITACCDDIFFHLYHDPWDMAIEALPDNARYISPADLMEEVSGAQEIPHLFILDRSPQCQKFLPYLQYGNAGLLLMEDTILIPHDTAHSGDMIHAAGFHDWLKETQGDLGRALVNGLISSKRFPEEILADLAASGSLPDSVTLFAGSQFHTAKLSAQFPENQVIRLSALYPEPSGTPDCNTDTAKGRSKTVVIAACPQAMHAPTFDRIKAALAVFDITVDLIPAAGTNGLARENSLAGADMVIDFTSPVACAVGVPALMAAAYDKPLITLSGGWTEEFHSIKLAAETDAHQLSAAICLFAENPDIAHAYGIANRAFASSKATTHPHHAKDLLAALPAPPAKKEKQKSTQSIDTTGTNQHRHIDRLDTIDFEPLFALPLAGKAVLQALFPGRNWQKTARFLSRGTTATLAAQMDMDPLQVPERMGFQPTAIDPERATDTLSATLKQKPTDIVTSLNSLSHTVRKYTTEFNFFASRMNPYRTVQKHFDRMHGIYCAYVPDRQQFQLVITAAGISRFYSALACTG